MGTVTEEEKKKNENYCRFFFGQPYKLHTFVFYHSRNNNVSASSEKTVENITVFVNVGRARFPLTMFGKGKKRIEETK